MPRRMHTFNNIRATHATAGTELFYGASSVFSLLQHLDVHLLSQAMPAPAAEADADEVQNGDETIQRYNYQGIAFDNVPTHFDRAAYCVFISPELARACLRNYLLTSHHRMPFLDPDKLCSTLEKLYNPGGSQSLEPSDRAIAVITMAIGAGPDTEDTCRQHLLAHARKETESMLYEINSRAVQIALLMAQCELEAGNPNLCYLQLGSAIRKAFAAGMHRARTAEAKQTMWSLYCTETLICFMFGRQYGLAEEDIAPPMLEKSSYMGSFVRLCTIVRSAYRIYRHTDAASIATDMELANSIRQQLHEFSSTVMADLGLEIGGQLYALTGDKLSWHATISYREFPLAPSF